jgi:hypothetical protein
MQQVSKVILFFMREKMNRTFLTLLDPLKNHIF